MARPLLSLCVARHMASWPCHIDRRTLVRMIHADRINLLVRRMRLSAREIAAAIALTIVAAAFLVTALAGNKDGDGPPLAVVERLP